MTNPTTKRFPRRSEQGPEYAYAIQKFPKRTSRIDNWVAGAAIICLLLWLIGIFCGLVK